MSYTLLTIAVIWRHRARLFWPILLLPLILIAAQFSHNTTYKAVTTLQLDAENIHSPLLSQISRDGHKRILETTLTSPSLLANTTKETGMPLTAQQFSLNVISDHLLQITLQSQTPNGLAQVLDAHAFNFIIEILAPERFRLAQQITSTEEEISFLSAQLKNTKDRALKQRLATQKRLLDETYKDLLKKNQSISTTNHRTANNVLWFAEPSRVIRPIPLWERSLKAAKQGIVGGFILGLLLILFHYMFHTTFRKDTDITNILGLKVIGHLPYFGTIRLNRGIAAIDMPPTPKKGETKRA